VQEYYYDDELKFVCVVIIRLEPSNYLSDIFYFVSLCMFCMY